MSESSRLFLFPDINVWVALTYERHTHHLTARRWFDQLSPTARLFFCRLTQLGLLRLLSSRAVMGADEVMSQPEAWETYDEWLGDDRIGFLDEPPGLDADFRMVTKSSDPSPKDWADSYLLAFASSARFQLVSFDKAMRSKSKDVILLV
jgi:uncharacterized protein